VAVGIASREYMDRLTDVFGPRRLVPGSFIGVGTVRRGSILLHAVDSGVEPEYVVVLSVSSAPRSPQSAQKEAIP